MDSETRRRVMVVDDSDVARETIVHTLRDAGFEVIERSSPIGVSREVIRQRVCAVVLDVEMPALRGDKLATLLRANSNEDVRLVLVSSIPEQQLRQIGQRVGADGVVPKARVASELVVLLERLSSGRSD